MKLLSHHLTYCTNIHPGETWAEVFGNLKQYLPPLKAKLAPELPFGIGLRLSDLAARELLQGNELTEFQAWLRDRNLYVFTLNGFPFGGFHHQVVKDKVYAPDWRDRSRLDYTLNLIEILSILLPEGMDGSISTLPLSYKPWHSLADSVFQQSSLNLVKAIAHMARIHQDTGKLIHLDLEPEPDGLLENTTEVIDFFAKWLIPIASSYSADLTPEIIREHLRVCYDTCHFAVEYEEPASVFERFKAADIKIGKIQLSAALKVDLKANDRDKMSDRQSRHHLSDRLSPFAESTYLHQVIERHSDGTLHNHRDLANALPQLGESQAEEWRIHFHVPLFIRDYQLLQSTQDDLMTVLKLLPDNPCNHLEIETYTWDVLPPEMKVDLLSSIAREYEWVMGVLSNE